MSDERFEEIVHRAVVNLCHELDKEFPGQNKGGVSDALAWQVELVVKNHLRDVAVARRDLREAGLL